MINIKLLCKAYFTNFFSMYQAYIYYILFLDIDESQSSESWSEEHSEDCTNEPDEISFELQKKIREVRLTTYRCIIDPGISTHSSYYLKLT